MRQAQSTAAAACLRLLLVILLLAPACRDEAATAGGDGERGADASAGEAPEAAGGGDGERSEDASGGESPQAAAFDADYCEKVWPDATDPTTSQSEGCALHWLPLGYGLGFGEAVPEDELTLDPVTGGGIARLYRSEQFRRMAAHTRAACGARCTAEEALEDPQTIGPARAIEYFEAEARAYGSTFDTWRMAPIDDLLNRILAGERISGEALEGYSLMSLWKLRNTVFARRGDGPMRDARRR